MMSLVVEKLNGVARFELALGVEPALRQRERVAAGGALEGAAERGERA